MTCQQLNQVHIGRVHIEAICAEIGARLPAALTGSPARLPPHLLKLIELLEGVECRDAPYRTETETATDVR
jgi:hypothetical protein